MLDMINPYLDAVNIDLKAFKDSTYRHIIGARLQPVLDSLKKVKQLGKWLEVTSLIIPGINDDPEEIGSMANFIALELGVDVPWHLSRFFPGYKMNEVAITPIKTLQKAKEIGREAGLKYIYIGNVASADDMDTKCPLCGYTLIERSGFTVIKNKIKDGHCPKCDMAIAGEGI